jgi:hypothetical protein
MVQIVQVNVYQDVAPTPSTLQQSGAVVSVGGTTLAAGASSTLTQASDLTSILASGIAVSSISWASSIVTITTAQPHGVPVGTTIPALIVGTTPANASLNGSLQWTSTTTTQLTAPLTNNPGSFTNSGVFTPESIIFLESFVDTFFDQGSDAAIDVLELGTLSAAAAITALQTYINNNLLTYYCYGLPDNFDGATGIEAFLASYTSTTSMVYFFLQTTNGTYTDYPSTDKDTVTFIPSPNAVLYPGERAAATMMYKILSYSPSAINMVTPMAFTEVYGVTPYPVKGNGPILATYKTAAVNVIQTASVGGIAANIITYGTTMDGRDFTYWYSVDWMQINVALNLSNAIINGSNNPVNPLYYNQAGIDTLQIVAQGTANSAISYGLAVGPITVTAIPFATYVVQNPDDYPVGKYAGMAMTYTPARGFLDIVFNIVVSDFIQA